MHDPIWRIVKRRRFSADRVLRFFGLFHPPVDVEMIARRMGVALVPASDPEWAGMVYSEGNTATIWVRSTDPQPRRRFTIAHELGHLILHDEKTLFRDATFLGSKAEAQANGYAAGLLMPLWMVTPHARRLRYDVDALARLFDVSEQAMAIRLERVGV